VLYRVSFLRDGSSLITQEIFFSREILFLNEEIH